jgi:hypothetical protein
VTEPTSDFHIHGFLGITSDTNAIHFWNENPEWHELVLNLHSIAIAAFQKVQVGNRDPQRILAYTVFYRLLTSYQAVALLSARGMDVEAKVMLRMMTEAIIVLVATSKDQSFAVRFIKADEDIRRRLLSSTLEVETKPEPGQKLFVTPLQIEQMKAELAELEHRRTNKILVNKIEIKEIATEAGLLALYRKHFAYFSLFAHLAPSGMRQFLVTNEKGDITHFRTGVFYDDAVANVRSAIVFVMMGLSTTNDLLSLAVQPAVDGISQRMEALIARIETAPEGNG